MAEPIEIVIRKTQETAFQKTSSNSGVKNNKKNSFVNSAVGVALVNSGKQLVSNVIQQYGDLTGNTLANKQLEGVAQIAGYVEEITVGGWVGAIVVATKIGIQGINNYTNRRKATNEANLLYERSGNVTIDGGRGTND